MGKKEILLSKRDEEHLIKLPHYNYKQFDILVDFIKNNYEDFEGCIIPDGYKILPVCIVDNPDDSSKDDWDLVIFDKIKKVNEDIGTITLDNMDALDNLDEIEEELVIIKIIHNLDYKGVIKYTLDIIKDQ